MSYIVKNVNGKLLAFDDLGRRLYSAWMIVTSQYGCNKRCPFCTAKITGWPEGTDKWDQMGRLLSQLQDASVAFDHVTVSGNGEPSMLSLESLRQLSQTLDGFPNMWKKKTFQTSGNIFAFPDKWELFKDYMFSITRMALQSEKDMEQMGYGRDYSQLPLFKKSKVTFNIPLLKNNINQLKDLINSYTALYPNLKSITLKILNLNTLDENKANLSSCSQWIKDNALPPSDREMVVETISSEWPLAQERDDFFDRYFWHGPVPIKMKAKRVKYGISNLVYYCGDIVDYEVRKRTIEEVSGAKIVGPPLYEIPQDMEDFHNDVLFT